MPRVKAIYQILPVVFLLLFLPGLSAGEEVCFECHGERDFVVDKDDGEVSLFVDKDVFSSSIHADIGCTSCHEEVDPDDLPHDENLPPVDCSGCHDRIARRYAVSLHGQALSQGKHLAPSCTSCHGAHDILPASDQNSRTYVMNIPSLCGACHKEGTPVSQLGTAVEHHVLQDYSQSIHGNGLFKRGLIVTAVCTSCHSSHDILPHEDPRSTINRNNIAKTCMQCHAQIERVHLKVIRGELWEKSPHEIPICIDCHPPHNVRKVFYEESFSDELCMSCHENEDLQTVVDGEEIPLFVDLNEFRNSAHGTNSCIKCHNNVSVSNDPVCLNSGKVDCSICHSKQVEDYQSSRHGVYFAEGNPIAPYCTNCHGVHNMKKKNELDSPTFSRNIPDLCGKCHREGQKAAVAYTGKEHDIVRNYTMSIHGKGLLQSGLLVTATCVDCHTAHHELPVTDPESSVYPDNVAATCAKCHLGIYEEYKKSVHSSLVTQTDKTLPVCKDCHLSHTIQRVDLPSFRQGILDQCGKCHLDVAETYFETIHGKVSKLGSTKAAKCYDCHGAHNILRPSDPNSTLSRKNVVATCRKCHPNSNRKFVGYLTHATHHNKGKYPILYYTFWFMTFLLIGTFSLFGAHTIMWIPKAIKERRAKGRVRYDPNATFYERFDPFTRFTHVLVILSFLSLAITGMTIKFSGVGVFQTLSRAMGGYGVTGYVHRYAAAVTFIYFALHIAYLIRRKRHLRMSLKEMLSGEDTLMFRKVDLFECGQTIKWFLGLGPRPNYGRWTYWEKFDYFAVFWGVAVIGSSGLLLWFSEFFTRIGFPGWFINVATIIHSDEALLATGFIFTIHFFNTHFRPEKFPMDPVIFTGKVPLEELKEDRPREYRRAIRTRSIRRKLVEPPPKWLRRGAKIFGLSCLSAGIIIILLTIYSMIFLYR